jgi:hypothetical protein
VEEGQFSGNGTNYLEWNFLFGTGTIQWGEGLIFERGTIYWEWDNLFGEGMIFESGTI